MESTGKLNAKAASASHAESSDLVPNIDAHTRANRSLGEQSARLEAVPCRSDRQFSHPQASREFEPSLKTKTVLRCCLLPDGVRQEYASQSGDASGFPVNTIPPDTEIHEQRTTVSGYGKVCTTTSTPSTSVRPLWTIT